MRNTAKFIYTDVRLIGAVIAMIICFVFGLLGFQPINMKDTQQYTVTISNIQRRSGNKKVWVSFDTEQGTCYYRFMGSNKRNDYERFQTLEGQTVTISVTEYNQYPYTQLAKGMLHVVDIRNDDTVFFTADDLNFTNTCVRVFLIAISVSLLAWSIYIFFRKTRKAKKTGDSSVSR